MSDRVELFLGDLKCELQRFSPKPGDVFVLTLSQEVSWEQENQMINGWKARFPNNEIVVIVKGARLELEAKA